MFDETYGTDDQCNDEGCDYQNSTDAHDDERAGGHISQNCIHEKLLSDFGLASKVFLYDKVKMVCHLKQEQIHQTAKTEGDNIGRQGK